VTHLLDTGVWIRAVNRPRTIPAAVLRVLRTPSVVFGLAAISLWEVGKKVQIGKLTLPKDLSGWFSDALASNLEVLPMSDAVVVDAMRLPEFPTCDPADELIVATARIHGLTVLTTDTRLKTYPHARIHYFKPRATDGRVPPTPRARLR
jgi:PIN domain nuclease of toxin-antitoxin system